MVQVIIAQTNSQGHYIVHAGWVNVRGWAAEGRMLIRTACSKTFHMPEGCLAAAHNLIKEDINALVVCGGDGSLTGANIIFCSKWLSSACCKQMARSQTSNVALEGIRTEDDGVALCAQALNELIHPDSADTDFIFIPERPPQLDPWKNEMCEAIYRDIPNVEGAHALLIPTLQGMEAINMNKITRVPLMEAVEMAMSLLDPESQQILEGFITMSTLYKEGLLSEDKTGRKYYPAFHIPMVHLPATISNSVPMTKFSLGSDTSLTVLIDAIMQRANSGKCEYIPTMGALVTGTSFVYTPERRIALDLFRADVKFLKIYYGLDAKNMAELAPAAILCACRILLERRVNLAQMVEAPNTSRIQMWKKSAHETR
ncbi:hypothetical protein SCLCIDRAFT_10309 [Scleroderma citrinum Foug A]|uniref:Phosphofructokinase domain-containing protein n=1 Tax=Scleroderma citrinum Foug A TaxID=1036808 RepID=A0A0C3A062_9AGAM|nr:hypothetical protein SCLCIDRAFT_10309 [Scleroderma citrinum Foug A]